MMIRTRLPLTLLRTALTSLVVVAVSAGTLTAKEGTDRRPNILFAMADDWGWPHAGAYGDATVQTPTFDRLAREGALFTYAFVSSPSCTPCRNAILTGQQFYRLGVGANLWSTLDIRHPNFMFLLRENGYEIGHWRKAWGPGDAGVGGYTESPCGPASTFPAFMEKRDPEKPFCFWFGTSDPHRSYKKDSGRESGMKVDGVHVPAFYPDHDVIRSDIADYYWEVQRWDRDMAAAIALLEKAGELDHTLVVMTGDHGMPFPRCKGNLYDWGVRVPLAVRWGDHIKSGRRVVDFTSLTDLAPTFLTLAGVAVPDVMTGRDLLPVLTGSSPGRADETRDFVVFGRERHTPAQMMPSMNGYPARGLRTDDWLLILNLEPARWPAGVPAGASHPMSVHSDCDQSPTKSFLLANQDTTEVAPFYRLNFAKRPAVELYDCRTDPDQVQNLAGNPEYEEVIETLRAQLTNYLAETGDPRFTEAPVRFDTFPYRRPGLHAYLKEHGFE